MLIPESQQTDVTIKVAEIAIMGMTCSACSSAVSSALAKSPGVISFNVSLITECASVQFKDVEPSVFVTAIDDAGFDAEIVKVTDLCMLDQPGIKSNTRKLEIRIHGMTCGSCTSSVQNAVNQIAGVLSASVSLTTELCTLTYKHPANPQQIISAIEDSGFNAELVDDVIYTDEESNRKLSISQLTLKVPGMNDEGSAAVVKTSLTRLSGVIDAKVDIHTSVASISFDKYVAGIRSIIQCIEEAGFSAFVSSTANNSQQIESLNRVKELKLYYSHLLITFFLGVPTIVIMKLRDYMPHFLTAKIGRGIWADDLLYIALVTPILLGPAKRFYIKAFKSLKAGTPTMDVLVSSSVTCAFAYSFVALIHSVVVNIAYHQMYLWDACAMILMFVILGKYLENLARGQTSQALSELISLVPEEALVVADDLDADGQLISTDLLQVNDVVILRPGERVSADGIVVEGCSFVDEALLTGESKSVSKTVGDKVVGGTINGLGTLKFRVTSCGADTKLSQIIALIKEAQGSRAPIQRYADIAASKFVPAILGLGLLTFFGWLTLGLIMGVDKLPIMFKEKSLFFTCLRLGIAVIVVACPCALGLATPTAVMVATGVGAKSGILVKSGATFELGAKASIVLFDKTGTLTTGKMSVVTNTVPAEYWPLIRALESYSEHPVGKALSMHYHPEEIKSLDEHQQYKVEEIIILPGEGIRGIVNGSSVFVGRRIKENDTQIVAIIDENVTGSILLQDSVRSEAIDVVEVLKQQGFKIGIVSGDSKSVVDCISQVLEIDDDYSWSLMHPDDKVRVVEKLQSEGHMVVFVGDGINDSPALATASVGISLEGATHVAVESANIVLTQESPIAAVPAALDLCKVTMSRIKLNLFVSVIYNVIMIPFAMGLFLPFRIMLSPMMASASMAMSSVSVVASSLLLKRWHVDRVNKLTESAKLHVPLWKRVFTKSFWKSKEVKYHEV